jgi:hypothetical protein
LEVLQEILGLPIDEQLTTLAFLWSIWTERNRGNHGEKHQNINKFHFSITQHVQEWKEYLKREAEPSVSSSRNWEVPLPDYVCEN